MFLFRVDREFEVLQKFRLDLSFPILLPLPSYPILIFDEFAKKIEAPFIWAAEKFSVHHGNELVRLGRVAE